MAISSSRRKFIWLCAIVGAVVFVLLLRPLAGVLEFHQFRTEHEAIEVLFESIEWEVPPDASQADWQHAWSLTYTGFGNATFSVDGVSVEEMRKLRRDLGPLIDQRPTSYDGLRRIWKRVGESSPRAKEYITRMQPLLDDVIPTTSADDVGRQYLDQLKSE